MIRFEEFDGLLCPVFFCQQCGQRIQGRGQGLIHWDWNDPADPKPIALHRGECDRAYGKPIPWRDLDKFLDQLTYNTRHSFREAS